MRFWSGGGLGDDGQMSVELGSRKRSQPAPPQVIFEALTQPRREAGRPWLELADSELEPAIVEADEPHRVVWSSPWPDRPNDRIEFEIAAAGAGSELRWTLLGPDESEPSEAVVGRMRYRLNELINGRLRYSFGQ
jgi:hypothetical protein